jgi:hypothetical protein
MWAWVDRVGATLLDAGLAALALSSLVALAMLGCRQPARRVRLARAGLLGTLALVPLTVLSPLPRFEVIAALRGAGLLDHPAVGLGILAPGPASADAPARPDGPLRLGPLWIGQPGPSRSLTILYLIGVAAGLGWLAFGHLGLAWLTRRSAEPSPEAMALYRTLRYAARGERPRLRVAHRVRGPALVGPLRPTILVPAGLDRPEASSALQMGLLHELAHAEAGDPLSCLVASLSQAVWFALPPVWWVRRQMRLDQEFLADRRAAGGFGPAPSYASSLLDLSAKGPQPAAPSLLAENPKGTGSALFQRVLMLVLCPFSVEPMPPRWWCWSLSGAIVAATLGASTLSLRTTSAVPVTTSAPAGSRTFRMPRLVVAARAGGPQGRAPLFELPMRLPDHFVLTVDVWGDPESLAQTRVVGHPLVLPTSGPDPLEDWHQVRLHRDARGVFLWIDGHPSPIDPRRATTTTWLSVEAAPGLPGVFRNLILSW